MCDGDPSIIKDALAWIAGHFRPDTTAAGGKEFVDEGYREIENNPFVTAGTFSEHGEALKLGTCDALLAFLNSSPVRDTWQESIRVVINKSGVVAYLNTIGDQIRRSDISAVMDFVRVPFKHPEKTYQFTYQGFLTFLDQYAGKVTNEDDLRVLLRNFNTISSEEIKMEDRGAFIAVEVKQSKNVEGSRVVFPKEIEILMPTGTREFEIANRFLFRINIDNRSASFHLIKVENDGSWEALIEQAMEKLSTGLPDDLVIEGV